MKIKLLRKESIKTQQQIIELLKIQILLSWFVHLIKE